MTPQAAPPPNPDPREMFTASQIARTLRRDAGAVIQALARLNIQPTFLSGAFKYYPPDVIPTLRRAMRKPNKTQNRKSNPGA